MYILYMYVRTYNYMPHNVLIHTCTYFHLQNMVSCTYIYMYMYLHVRTCTCIHVYVPTRILRHCAWTPLPAYIYMCRYVHVYICTCLPPFHFSPVWCTMPTMWRCFKKDLTQRDPALVRSPSPSSTSCCSCLSWGWSCSTWSLGLSLSRFKRSASSRFGSPN